MTIAERRDEGTGRLLVVTLLLTLLLPSRGSAQGAPAMDSTMHGMPEMEGMAGSDSMMTMSGPLGISTTRDGSGTSWLPDVTPMAAVRAAAGSWEIMLHGNAFAQYIDQGSDRGASQFGSVNWLMGMARRRWAGGELGFRAMMSAEPFTIPGCGYPILLASGEVCDGRPIHDAQHPHDLFMELAGRFQRPLGDHMAIELYGGPAGEPALGPVAFPHRTSALPNPLAPISHHWFDATHISFGVATAGLYGRRWKVEGSLFNGREPDEDRLGIDLAPLDSYSGRVWLVPNNRWAIQLSAGQLNGAEPGHEAGAPRLDVARYTTSATYHQPLGGGGMWASTAGFGRNVEEGRGSNALLLESSVSLADRHLFFGRAEWTEKSGEDLGIPKAPVAFRTEIANFGTTDRMYDVGTVALGYTRQFDAYHGWLPGIGARGSVNFVPDDLEAVYGQKSPMGFGFTVFASFRPAAMGMRMGGDHQGMGAQQMAGTKPGSMDMSMPMDSAMKMPMPADSSAMTGHGMAQNSSGMAHAVGDTASTTGMMSDERMQRMNEIFMRMMADSVIRERVTSDPVLQRMMEDVNGAMGMSMEPSATEQGRALDFIVRLLSNPVVEARIHADPRLHQLWSDPAVQARLRELRGQQLGGQR